MSRRKNAGEGYGFNFHGAFTDKEDAVKKEKKTPGSFIKGRLTAHGYRWIVMSPRTNPIKRRRRNPVPYRITFIRHGQQFTWERFANTAAEATKGARAALQYEYPDRDYKLISVKPMSANPYEESKECKVCHASVAKSALDRGVCGSCREILGPKGRRRNSSIEIVGPGRFRTDNNRGTTLELIQKGSGSDIWWEVHGDNVRARAAWRGPGVHTFRTLGEVERRYKAFRGIAKMIEGGQRNPIDWGKADPKIRKMIAQATKLAHQAAKSGDINKFHRHMQTIKMLEQELEQLQRDNPHEKPISLKEFRKMLDRAGYGPGAAVRGVTRSQAEAYIRKLDEIHDRYSTPKSIEGPLFGRENPATKIHKHFAPHTGTYSSAADRAYKYADEMRAKYPGRKVEIHERSSGAWDVYVLNEPAQNPGDKETAIAAFRKMSELQAKGQWDRADKIRMQLARLNARMGWTMAQVSEFSRLSNPGELIVLGANPMRRRRNAEDLEDLLESSILEIPIGTGEIVQELETGQVEEIAVPAGATLTIRANPLQPNPICGNPVGGGMRCSRKPGHKGPHLPQGATLRPRSRVPSAWVGRRANPSAAAIREEFTGKPSEKFFVQDAPGMPAGDYAQLGELLALYVKPVGGGQRQTIDFRQDRPLLLCDETRRQLYFLGGDQDVSAALPAFGIHHATGTSEILLGALRRIDYKQRKEHAEQPELDEWRHELGEETHVYPDLYFDPANKRLALRGGEYEVRREGIVN